MIFLKTHLFLKGFGLGISGRTKISLLFWKLCKNQSENLNKMAMCLFFLTTKTYKMM